MRKAKSPDQSKRLLLLVLGLVVIAALIATAMAMTQDKPAATPSPTPTKTSGNSTQDEPADYNENPTPTKSAASPAASPGTTPVGQPAVLSKPILQKSSGNAPGSSVPAGAVIQFTCEGAPGLSCEILLTDMADSGRTLNLGKKPIQSNGRGAYFATFDWTAQAGTWWVVAKASNASGGSATSDAQTLSVKP